MGLHTGKPSHWLVAALLLLLLVQPGSALNTRQESQKLRGTESRRNGINGVWSARDGSHSMSYHIPEAEHAIMNYQVPAKAASQESGSEKDDDSEADDDDDDDDDESEEDKAAEKAREAKELTLKRNVEKAKAKLQENLDEQEDISAQMDVFENAPAGNDMIDVSVKAVANETESTAMAAYLGDMWKEMRMFQSPFYQEHIMERYVHLKRRERVLQKRHKAEQLKLKKQKLAWAKEDAQGDAEDETDPKKKEEGEKKVAKLDKEEKQVEKEEKVAKLSKKEEKVEEEEEAFDITGKPPWMRNKKKESPAPKAKKAKPAEDNTVKPDWMKALEGSDAKGKKAKKPANEEEQDEDDEADAKKKEPKKEKDEKDDDDDDDEDDDEETEKKSTKKDKKEDDEDFDITGKPPWMKDKKKQKKAAPSKKPKPAEDNTVKPDWMKALETSDDEEKISKDKDDEKTDEDEEDSADEEAPAAKKKVKKAKKAKKTKSRKEAPEPPPADGKYKPMFTHKTMPRVSPAVECVMVLAWQFFIVYTALALLRGINQVSRERFAWCLRAQKLVEMVCPYVMFAPMLCVLFLATRMRAIQLSQGDTGKYELPQPWVQMGMYLATYGVMWQAVFKLLMFMMSYRIDADGVAMPMPSESSSVNIIYILAKYVFMGCIYGGFTVVCIGTLFMPAPKDLWGDTPPEFGTALGCTMMLTTTFFVVYLGLSLFRTVEEIRPTTMDDFNVIVKVQLLFWRARHAVNLAPMLCILFIVAHMHSLHMETKLPRWAETAMSVCAGAVVFQVLASIVLPLIDRNAYILPGPVQGQIILVMSIAPLRIVGDLIRYIPLLLMCGGASAVVAAIYYMMPNGPWEESAHLSSTATCSIALTTLYFAVFTLVFLAQSVIDRLPESGGTKRFITVLDAGQRTVMFAPMLCLLFIAALLRAQQLTRTVDGHIPPSAGPQKWVQNGMYFATGSVFVQVLMAYVTTSFLGPGYGPATDDLQNARDEQHAPRSTSTDPDMSSSSDKRTLSPNRAVGLFLESFKFLCLIAMYGGAVAVMVGIVIMTPETLPPYEQGTPVALSTPVNHPLF